MGAAATKRATRGEQTREAILTAAIARFGREGFRSTSVADVARDAGVGGTVTYAYFPNKEALFLAAIDEDAATLISQAVTSVLTDAYTRQWRQTLIFKLLDSMDDHPLAKRVLAGLEPEVTGRVLEIPALNDLRTAVAHLLRSEQESGTVRPDIDPTALANGIVAIMLSLLMSVVQLGPEIAQTYMLDVAAVLGAAVDPAPGAAAASRRTSARRSA